MRLPTLILVVVLACGPGDSGSPLAGPPPGFPNAYAHSTCAPWDGAAVAVYLTAVPVDSGVQLPPATNYIEITVWRGLDRLADSEWTWPTTEQVGSLTLCKAQGECEPATAGVVRFRPADSTGTLSGSMEAAFPSGTTAKGGFRAAWRTERVLCG